MNSFIISAIPTLIALFWCFVFLIVGFLNKDYKKYFLAAIMLVFAFIYIGNLFYLNSNYTLYWYWSIIFLISNLILFPFIYYFVKSAILNYKLSRYDFRILYPAFLLSLLSFVLFFLINPDEKSIYLQQLFSQEGSIENWNPILYLQKLKITIYPLLLFFTALLSIMNIHNITKKYKHQEINIDQTSKKNIVLKLNRLQILLASIIIIYAIVIIINRSLFVEINQMGSVYSLMLGAITFMVGYWGYGFDTQPALVLNEFGHDYSLNGKDKKSFQKYTDSKYILKKRLIALLEEDNIFKNEDLRLADVVKMLHSNRSCTSYVINSLMHSTFSDLINDYRVEYAKRLLFNDKNNSLTMNEIMAQSGFKSNSSFFRVFKQKTGFTPKEYKLNYCPTEKPQQYKFHKAQNYLSNKSASLSTLLLNKLSR